MMTGWTKPGNLAFLEARGPDAVRFLNGQVTNDIKGDLSRRVVPACVCSMKGKIEALVRITAGFSENSILIEVEAEQADAVQARLDRYLVADDCELTRIDSPPELIHIISAQTVGREHWRYGLRGCDIFGEADLAQLRELPEKSLQLQSILHGIPGYGLEITGGEFPAELGLDRWAVDFHKGCYLGQEVISRIESSGKVPRRLRLFSTDQAFKRGYIFSGENGKEIAGVVRDSIEYPAGKRRFLTSLLAKPGFENPGFEEIEIQFPPKA